MPIVPFSKAARNTLGQQAPVPPPMDWALMAAAQMHSEDRLIEPGTDPATMQRMKRKREIENNPNTWHNTDDMRNKTLGPKNNPGEQIIDPAGLDREVQRI